jgi:hypothetical protein
MTSEVFLERRSVTEISTADTTSSRIGIKTFWPSARLVLSRISRIRRGERIAIARSFAEGMNGSLDYKRIDDLTIFEVVLPIAEAVAARSDDSEPTMAEAEDLEAAQTV